MVARGLGGDGGGYGFKRTTRGTLTYGDGNVLYFDCLNVTIPVLIFYYSFVICYHWGKLVKGT